MISFWQQLRTRLKFTDSQTNAQLKNLILRTGAKYAHLILSKYQDQDTDNTAGEFFQQHSGHSFDGGLGLLVTKFNISQTHLIKPSLISAQGDDGTSLGGETFGFSHWAYIPIDFDNQRIADLYLAFDNGFPSFEQESNLLDTLLSLTEAGLMEGGDRENPEEILSLGHDLTGINTRKEFQYFINSTLAGIIPFSACTFFLTDIESNRMENFFFDSSNKITASPFNSSVPEIKLPIDDEVDSRYFNMDKFMGYDLDELIKSEDLTPYINPESGLKNDSGLLFGLFSGNSLMGYCLMLFPQQVSKTRYKNKIKVLVPYFSATVLRIRMAENVERVKRELEIMEAINRELAVNKEKSELMRSLYPHMSRLFSFSHHFVAVVNNDKFTVSLLLGDSSSKAKQHPHYNNTIESSFLINDQILNKVLLSNEPVEFDLEQLAARNALPQYMLINYETGIRRMVMMSLQIDGLRIGIWAICLLPEQHLNKVQMANVKVISNQISLAARDFQNQEILIRQNSERDFLSQMSAQIAMVNQREDLYRILVGPLKSKMRFSNVAIVSLDEADGYRLFLHTAHESDALNEYYQNSRKNIYSASDGLMSRLIKARDLVVYDVEALRQMSECPEYLTEEHRHGVRMKVGFRLLQGEKVSGAVFFNLAREGFSDKELELLMNISLQISTAVSHILAIEDIAERQRERDLLFSLSTQIAAVRNHQELAKVITSRLKPHLGFSHLMVGRLDDKGENYSLLPFESSGIYLSHENYKSLESESFTIEDSYTLDILASDEPVSFDLHNPPAHHKSCPLYVNLNRSCGSKYMTGLKLSRNGLDSGFIIMFFEHYDQWKNVRPELLTATSNHLATGVYNITANEEVRALLELRSKLLNFGIELRMVKDEKVLSKLLSIQLKTLFNAENFLVTAFDADRAAHRAIFYDHDSELGFMPEFQTWTHHSQEVSQGMFNQILNAESPLVFEAEDLSQSLEEPLFVKNLAAEYKKGFVGAVMKLGTDPVGMILFQHDKPEEVLRLPELFLSILSQIAIVIVNIQSHRKVQQQLKEIEAYKMQLEEEKIYLTNELETVSNYTEIIGQSPALNDSFNLVSQVSASDSTVLILGETGTGKELIARAIHNNSPRRNKMMVKVNCAALPANLIESELFGHERGSFTGATDKRLGKFELANGSTLFLDEIGEMPLDLQVKLLRALQEKEIERVGGRGTIKVDVRIIAATNRDLEKEIDEGRFRTDLFYRLNIFPIFLPPLRERKEDIEPLVYHFLQHFSKKNGKMIDSISAKALLDLQRYPWPGNVRELEHLIERSVLLTNSNVIKEVLLPTPKEQHLDLIDEERDIFRTIDQNEKEHIYRVLKYCAGRIAGRGGAAEILGVPPTTLNSKIKRLGIKRGHIM